MIFSQCQESFTTQLSIIGITIDRKFVIRILVVWISEDAGDWSVNTKKTCKKSYGRISSLSKLKEDLVDIYCLFIRSTVEYCSMAFTSSLTVEQKNKLTNIEKNMFATNSTQNVHWILRST